MIKCRHIILILAFAAFLGCASGSARQDPIIVYPVPPEEPKIAYVTSYQGESDFKKGGILDFILGAQTGYDFSKPYGVFVKNEKIFVTDSSAFTVFVLDTARKKFTTLGQFALPVGIAVSSDGTVFVSDPGQKRVLGYSQEGTVKVGIGKKGELTNPAGIAINNDLGRLYVADSYGHLIHVYSLKGEKMFEFGRNGTGDGEFHFPTNVAIDRRNGNVVVVDTQNFRVQIFDKDGKFIRKFGQLGDAMGTFSRPKGVGVDSEGHIYVVDAAFDNFQVFDEKGQLLIFVGSAGRGPGNFELPAGMYIDESDRIYVVDSLNRRIQVFQYLSENWKKRNPEEYKKYLLQ